MPEAQINQGTTLPGTARKAKPRAKPSNKTPGASGGMTLGEVLGRRMTLGEVLGRKPEPQGMKFDSVAGVQVPGGVSIPAAAQPIFEFAQGFNARLAELVAAPVELVDQGLRLAGTSILENPGNATAAVRKGFEAVGINAKPLDSLSGEIGKEFFDGTLSLVAITAAAPSAIAQLATKTPTVAQKIGTDLARFFVEQPGLAVGTELGAAAGSVIGKRVGGPIGQSVGALVGGVGAAGVPAAVRIGAKTLTVATAAAGGATVGALTGTGIPGAVAGGGLAGVGASKLITAASRGVKGLLGRRPPLPAAPLLGPGIEGAAKSGAAEAVATDLATAEKQIAGIINSLPDQSPEEAGIALRAGIDRALRIARQQENAAFSEGFLSEKTSSSPLVDAAKKMRREMKAASPATPSTELTRIFAEFISRRKVKTPSGQTIFVREPREVTARQIQDFRSDLLNAARNNGSGPNPSRRLVRNLNILADAALDSLRQVDEAAVENALQTSRTLNRLFFRGPMGRIMRRTTGGEPTLPEELTARNLLGRPRGLRQIEEISNEFGAEDIKPLTRDAIRAMFRAEAERGGAPAEAFLRKNRSAIESFADEALKLQSLTDDLVAAETAKIGAQKGALAKFAAEDPTVGITRLFANANPAEAAASIRSRLAKDKDALAGFEHDILAELFRRAQFSAIRLKADLEATKVSRLAKAALSPDQFKRLKAIVDVAARAEAGTIKVEGVAGRVLNPVFDLVARFTGAGLGRQIGAVTGGTTIQQTGAAASFAKSVVQRLTGKIPPADAFALAVTDPKFERILMSAIPTNAAEIAKFNRAMRALISAETALGNQFEDDLADQPLGP